MNLTQQLFQEIRLPKMISLSQFSAFCDATVTDAYLFL
jgi:hypothetical protein